LVSGLAAALAVSAAAQPVVVELFTSQACSSCPPADRLLSSWGAAQFRSGRVLPLSFGIDYWDELGWKDVFSAPSWSQRQTRYAQALGTPIYTPQMVVAGREAFVGSDAARAAAAVARFSGGPPRAKLSLKVLASPQARLEIEVEPSSSAAGLHAMLALFENGLLTHVSRGENEGRALRNDFVVRRLVDLGPLESGKTLRLRTEEPWDPGWKKFNAGAALFLQDPKTLAVYDARSAFPVAAKEAP
jgi:hypothetical protein